MPWAPCWKDGDTDGLGIPTLGSESVLPGPAAWATPGNFLELQESWPPGLTESESAF